MFLLKEERAGSLSLEVKGEDEDETVNKHEEEITDPNLQTRQEEEILNSNSDRVRKTHLVGEDNRVVRAE